MPLVSAQPRRSSSVSRMYRSSSASERTPWRSCQRQSRHSASVAFGKNCFRPDDMGARKMLRPQAPVKDDGSQPPTREGEHPESNAQYAYVPLVYALASLCGPFAWTWMVNEPRLVPAVGAPPHTCPGAAAAGGLFVSSTCKTSRWPSSNGPDP